jgi:prephenate dehydrogenase
MEKGIDAFRGNAKGPGIAINKVAIAGLGLIGGSIAMALKERGMGIEIVGIDRNTGFLNSALGMGIIDRSFNNKPGDLEGVQLLVIAVPVGAMESVLEGLLPYLPHDCVITDVASVKRRAITSMTKMLEAGQVFVGGHPMAGSEKSGIAAARADLFDNAAYVLTPTGSEPDAVIRFIEGYVRLLGARPVIMTPEQHDRLVAMISHMPYIAAICLNLAVSNMDSSGDAKVLAAGGFRDITRVASSDAGLWAGICIENRDALIEVIKVFREQLCCVEHLINDGRADGVENILQMAKAFRDTIPNPLTYGQNSMCCSKRGSGPNGWPENGTKPA